MDTPYGEPLTRQLLDAAQGGSCRPGRRRRPWCSRTPTATTLHGSGSGSAYLDGAEVISTEASLAHLCAEPTSQQMRQLTHHTSTQEPLGWYMRRHFGSFPERAPQRDTSEPDPVGLARQAAQWAYDHRRTATVPPP
ncbi:hypothetical protein HLK59_09570 [Streptomyces sp. S3(2020)]|uniref:hypothetical protein n=1 Tax=Streptomyces sp. S3(2020) TaxID=2732044 RepID=UPI0014878066|nr:hypothetical protein [Streptomyces sp. S3(2020)]NNN30611.1 hypothetical protein [Streptomyces sp. S3(2020)]